MSDNLSQPDGTGVQDPSNLNDTVSDKRWTLWSNCDADGYEVRFLHCKEKDPRACPRQTRKCSQCTSHTPTPPLKLDMEFMFSPSFAKSAQPVRGVSPNGPKANRSQ